MVDVGGWGGGAVSNVPVIDIPILSFLFTNPVCVYLICPVCIIS